MFFSVCYPLSWITIWLPFPVTGIVVCLFNATYAAAWNDLDNLLVVLVVLWLAICIEDWLTSNLCNLFLNTKDIVVILLIVDTGQVLAEIGSCLEKLCVTATCL